MNALDRVGYVLNPASVVLFAACISAILAAIRLISGLSRRSKGYSRQSAQVAITVDYQTESEVSQMGIFQIVELTIEAISQVLDDLVSAGVLHANHPAQQKLATAKQHVAALTGSATTAVEKKS